MVSLLEHDGEAGYMHRACTMRTCTCGAAIMSSAVVRINSSRDSLILSIYVHESSSTKLQLLAQFGVAAGVESLVFAWVCEEYCHIPRRLVQIRGEPMSLAVTWRIRDARILT